MRGGTCVADGVRFLYLTSNVWREGKLINEMVVIDFVGFAGLIFLVGDVFFDSFIEELFGGLVDEEVFGNCLCCHLRIINNIRMGI